MLGVPQRSRMKPERIGQQYVVFMDEELRARLERSGYHHMGFAADYDRYRPGPPSVLLELLPLLAGGGRPRLVVDLGSGTGLSTRPWAEVAEQVVGIEPNDAMRDHAEGASTWRTCATSGARRTRRGCQLLPLTS